MSDTMSVGQSAIEALLQLKLLRNMKKKVADDIERGPVGAKPLNSSVSKELELKRQQDEKDARIILLREQKRLAEEAENEELYISVQKQRELDSSPIHEVLNL